MVHVGDKVQGVAPTNAEAAERAAVERTPRRAPAPARAQPSTTRPRPQAQGRVVAQAGGQRRVPCPLPPPNHPDWDPIVPSPPSPSSPPLTISPTSSWVPGRRPPTPPDMPRSPWLASSLSLSLSSDDLDASLFTSRATSRPATPPPSSPTSSVSSSETEPVTAPVPTWHYELDGVLDLPLHDWRTEHIDFGVAGVDMHFASELLADDDDEDGGEKVDPNRLISPRFTAGLPLALESLAEFSALRMECGLGLTYEEHAAIRAADAAALFKMHSPNVRDAGGLHSFFLSTRAARTLVYQWRSADALSSIILNDRMTDSITMMLSVRPDFHGLTIDGDMLDIVAHIPEALLGPGGLPLPQYAAAINTVTATFRHAMAVPYVRDFVRRLQASGRLDFPPLSRPALSPAAASRLRSGQQATHKLDGTPTEAAALQPCSACSAESCRTESTRQTSACVCQSKRRVIPRLPGILTAQGWQPEAKAQIMAAITGVQDSPDVVYATLRSLHICGWHTVEILDAVRHDLKHSMGLVD